MLKRRTGLAAVFFIADSAGFRKRLYDRRNDPEELVDVADPVRFGTVDAWSAPAKG